MYSAWQVVRCRFPKLPQAPVAQVRWLLLLSQGADAAAAQPQQAGATAELLWAALRHSSVAVSAAAAVALAQWPVAVFEALELDWQLCSWTQVRQILSKVCERCASANIRLSPDVGYYQKFVLMCMLLSSYAGLRYLAIRLLN